MHTIRRGGCACANKPIDTPRARPPSRHSNALHLLPHYPPEVAARVLDSPAQRGANWISVSTRQSDKVPPLPLVSGVSVASAMRQRILLQPPRHCATAWVLAPPPPRPNLEEAALKINTRIEGTLHAEGSARCHVPWHFSRCKIMQLLTPITSRSKRSRTTLAYTHSKEVHSKHTQ
jgi:hypothetical protein